MLVKPIKGFPDYSVSKCGRVYKWNTNTLMTPNHKEDGYVHIALRVDGVRKFLLLHRVVYEAWNGEIPDGFVVDHDDNNRANCHADNLVAMTQKDNINKKFVDMTCPRITNDAGDILQVTRPTHEFCKEHKIVNSNLCQVMKGTRKTANGWRLL